MDRAPHHLVGDAGLFCVTHFVALNVRIDTKNEGGQKLPRKSNIHLMEFSAMVNDLENKPDVELFLLSMAYMDKALRMALKSRMPAADDTTLNLLFDSRGALFDLAPKITLATALGLLPKEVAHDLGILRGLRNDMAHQIRSLSFDDDSVKDRVANLVLRGDEDRKRMIATINNEAVVSDAHIGISPVGDGRFIDKSIHSCIINQYNQFTFYCLGTPSDSVDHQVRRRYLESYWVCIFVVMGSAVSSWGPARSRE